MIKKRSLSLIEVMISLGLLSLLLSTLFFWYHSLTKQKEECRKLKWPLMEERYAFQRLNSCVLKAELPFFTTESGLVFSFDHGVDSIPALSGKVLAHLYYDATSQQVRLGIWPMPNQDTTFTSPSYCTVLLEGVASCTFDFYQPADPFKQPVNPEEVGKSRPKDGWHQKWEAAYHTLPALVRIYIKRDPKKGLEEPTVHYCFDLPVKIVYPQEKSV